MRFDDALLYVYDFAATSISEYCAARGSTGAKLLGTALGVAGVLQISNAVVLRQVCALSWTAFGLLLAGAIIGQLESGDLNDDPPNMVLAFESSSKN